MKHKCINKISFSILIFLLSVMFMKGGAMAATFNDINADNMFFKQNTSTTCTLSSAAMLVRRAALLNGNANWSTVTEANMRSTAWLSGTGLYNSFSYAGINVSSAKISSNRTQTMINLLSQHPEGIVIYDYGKPHAILLTDYTNGTFYCCDPSSAAPGGRIPISQATITIESVDKYWYVASPKLSMSVIQPVNIKPTVGNVQITSSNGYTSYSCQVTTGMGGARATVEYIRDGVKSDPVSVEIVNNTISGYVSRFSSTLTVTVTVTDQAGNVASNSTSVDYKPIRLSANRLSLTAGESEQIQLFCADLYELNEKRGSICKLSDGRTPVELSDEGAVSAHLPGQYLLWYSYTYTQYNPPGSEVQPAMTGITNSPIIVDVRLESPVVQTLSADTAGNVYIDFSNARGADGYEVCRTSEDGKITETVRVSGSGKQCVGNDLPDNTRWNYKVRAYTILPEETSYSGRYDPITGTIPSYMPEETIYSDWTQAYDISTINLTTTIKPIVKNIPGSVTVSWEKVPSAEGYLVYRTEEKDSANRKLLMIVEAEETTYMDDTVISGAVYRYEVIPYLGTEFGMTQNPVTVTAKEKEDTDKSKVVVKSGNVRLSKTNVIWNGKAQKPSVTAKDSKGKIISSSNYTVKYSNNKNVGQATATITFKNDYTGTVKKTFTIVPKGTTLSKVVSGKKGFTVQWKKQKSQTTGYEIQYSTSSKFKGAKTIKNIKAKATSKKVTKLKVRKKYYVRIRTYKTVKINGKSTKIYSGWSKAKKVVTKK